MALFKKRPSPVESGGNEPMYLPRPLANMSAVLEPFWDEYSHFREAGMEGDESVDQSLTALLPSDQLDEVLAMLCGELDQQLSVIKPFEGRPLKAGLIESGDKTWHKFQELPGWPD